MRAVFLLALAFAEEKPKKHWHPLTAGHPYIKESLAPDNAKGHIYSTELGGKLKALIKSDDAKMDKALEMAKSSVAEIDMQVKKRKEALKHRKKGALGKPDTWETDAPSSLLQTAEVAVPKPTSLLEADARVADGMKELDKVLSFDELDDKPASSLIELPGLAQQKEKFEAARQKLHLVQQSIADDSKRMQDNARRAASSLMEAPSSLMETQSQQHARMLALSKASQGVQSWAASIASKQNNFIKKMMSHGVQIPPRLREAMAQDQAFSLIQSQSKPSVMDKIPVTNVNPQQVDEQMKAVEHRLRHDAQIFQEEADSGRRPILPSSFLQRDVDDDDDDKDAADDAKLDHDTSDEPPNPVKDRFNEMKDIRKELRADGAKFEDEDNYFKESTRKAKEEMAAWRKRNAKDLKEDAEEQAAMASSFLEEEPKVQSLGEVGKSLHDLDMRVKGEKAEWASKAKHAKFYQSQTEAAYKQAVEKFKKRWGMPKKPMSLLQTGNGATLSEMLNDQDGEAATSALNEWKNHLDGDRRERAQSHRSLEKELAFKAADFGPELLDKYENGGRMSFLQETDEMPDVLSEQLANIEQKARNHANEIIGAPVDDTVGSFAETKDAPEEKPVTDQFQGVMTPGVMASADAADAPDPADAGEASAAKAEEAAVADEKAVEAADSAEKAEEQAEQAQADAEAKEDDQLRKQK